MNLADFNGLANATYGSSEKPYSTIWYEPSPLSRPVGQYSAGTSWYEGRKNDSIKYQLNSANEVPRFQINSSNLLEKVADYDDNTLYKTVVTDPDGKTSTEYKDNLGQVVMKQSDADVKTCYVYDDFGHLSYVLPPIATDSLNTGVIKDDNGVLRRYAYRYKYDGRGNTIEKCLPGCEPIYMIYDKADRMVLSQDGNQRDSLRKSIKQWTVVKYDMLGRVVFTGILSNDSTKDQFKDVYSKNILVTETYTGTGTGYSINYFGAAKPLTLNYYDDYSFTSIPTNGSKLNWVVPPTGYDMKYIPPAGIKEAVGLLTGTRTYILDNVGTNYLTTAQYYDDKGRVVQTRATNHLGGYDYSYHHYDFTGKVKGTYKVHNTATQTELPETYTYDYDHAGRPTTTTYKIFNDQVILTNNTYDELGRLQYTYRHGGADTISYQYNIRNWTTQIKNGTFAENLGYNIPGDMAATPCFNGNISSASCNNNGASRYYNYQYDELNRLNLGVVLQISPEGYPCGATNVESLDYDKQGNIKTLVRLSGSTWIDGLNMTYTGNQVKSVTDSYGSQGLYDTKEYNDKANTSNEMSYDKNGNMVKDLDRDIVTIRYNVLNLPDTIQFKYGNQILNRYAADGRKLYTEYFTKNTQLATPIDTGSVYNYVYNRSLMTKSGTDYVGNMEYNASYYTLYGQLTKGYNLWRVHNPEGYTDTFNSSYVSTNFNYFRRDHLGNTRETWLAPYTVFVANNFVVPGTVVQRTQYYPSGLPWAEGESSSLQPYKYNGKEFVEMNGLDTYDYGVQLTMVK